jgi:hypothetical protein
LPAISKIIIFLAPIYGKPISIQYIVGFFYRSANVLGGTRMRLTRILSVVALGITLAGAPLVAQEVQVSFDQQARFNTVKSYKLAKVQATDPLVESRMAAAVDRFLQGFGWRQVQKDPDVLVTVVQSDGGEGYQKFYTALDGYDWHEPWASGNFTDSFRSPMQVAQGVLIVDLYSASNRKLMWRGLSPQDPQDKERKKEDEVDKTVETMFKNFPPKSGGPMAPNQIPVADSPSSKPVTGPS